VSPKQRRTGGLCHLLSRFPDQVHPAIQLSQLVMARRRVGEDLHAVESHVDVWSASISPLATSNHRENAQEGSGQVAYVADSRRRGEELLAHHRVLSSDHGVPERHVCLARHAADHSWE
jgi:hypothetical protein